MANMLDSDEGTKHRDLRPAEIRKGEHSVEKATIAIQSFLNPFNVDSKDHLLILSSVSAASPDIVDDVMKAEEHGQQAHDDFIETRLKIGQGFFESIKPLNLKTLSDMNKCCKVKTNKVIKYKQQGKYTTRSRHINCV